MKSLPNYASCRVYGHHWDSVEIGIAPKFYEELLRCDSCGVDRIDTVCRTGKDRSRTLKRRYKYPSNYTNKDKLTKQEIRLGVLDREGYES